MVMKTFLGDAVKWIVLPKPDLSSGPGAGYTDKYYRHLHRPDPFDRRMMEKVIPDRIICDNMGHIVGMK